VDESKSVREMIRVVKEEAVGAYENEEVSYEKVVEEVGAERETSRSPVVQVMMALQNAPQVEMKLRGLDLEIIDIELGTAKSDLAMELQETEEGLEGSLEYSTDLFDASTICRMVSHFRNLLESVVEDPEQRISDLKMLSASERRQMLYEWNDTGRRETTWRAHELFQQQAKRSPEAVAVEYCRRQISYRELDERSNQLAHYLRNIGMLPGTRVGVLQSAHLRWRSASLVC